MALSPQERSRRMRLNMLMAMSYAVAGRSAFTPLSLFSAGEVGAWYDPSDFSTMFQDSAGTTPVTAVEQPVGLIRDKSGRGNHASQSTSTSRPVLGQEADGRYYLSFDGTDDSLATAAINFSATDKMSVFAGVRKLSDAAAGSIVELSLNPAVVNGSFAITHSVSGASYSLRNRGTAGISPNSAANYAAPITSVLRGAFEISTDTTSLFVNGSSAIANTTDMGTGNYSSNSLYIGRRAGSSLPFNGRLYSLIVRGARSTDTEIANTEAWVNTKTRAY